MNKIIAVTVIAVTFAVFSVLGGAGAQSNQGRISVTGTIATVRQHDRTYIAVYRLWNRTITGVPIGSAYIVCDILGTGGVLGGGVSSCDATFHLPLGKITASGIRHATRHWSLIITGGTGRYVGAIGSVHRREDLPSETRFILLLQ